MRYRQTEWYREGRAELIQAGRAPLMAAEQTSGTGLFWVLVVLALLALGWVLRGVCPDCWALSAPLGGP